MPLSGRDKWPVGAATLLLAASLLLYWPGYALFDSVGQYQEALSGDYADWHPPIMARLWALLHAVVGGAAGPMLALQLALYWCGLGLIAQGLAGAGRPRAAATVLAIGASPLFLGWQAVVLKDSQMAGALLAAVGLIADPLVRGRPAGWSRAAAAALLVGYATLVRTNAVFATVPLAVLLAAPRAWRWRAALGLLGVAGVLALTPIINHRLLGAEPSGVETTQPLYDLAGIVRFGGADALPAPQAAAVLAKHCYKPFFWDPLGDPARCDADMQPLRDGTRGALLIRWARAVLRHPLAYAAHRMAHLNSTERWLVPANLPSADPPRHSEPNDLGLGDPAAVARGWQAAAGLVALTPFGWPIAYLALGLALAVASRSRPPDGARRLAIALLGSALALEASFAVVSIASDLRYHLWPMLAVALAGVLLADRAPPRRVALAGGAALALVLFAAIAARVMLPPGPPTYRAMLG